MMFKQAYDGKFYDTIEYSNIDLKDVDISILKPIEVKNDELIEGEVYLNDNGSTVRYMGDCSYEVLERTPLYINDKIVELTDKQLRMFWTLVKNCKNGTYNGI